MVYDAPLLEYNLIDRKQQCGGDKSTCEANGLIVGDMLTQDPYGIVLAEGHPAHEALKIASISRITNGGFMTSLEDQWFPTMSEEDGGLPRDRCPLVSVSHIVAHWWLAADGRTDGEWRCQRSGGAGRVEICHQLCCWLRAHLYTHGALLVIIHVALCPTATHHSSCAASRYRWGWFKIKGRADVDEVPADTHDFNYLMYRILRKGKSDIYMRDDSDLIHEMASELRDVKKLLLDLLLMQDKTPDRLSIEGMRKKYAQCNQLDLDQWKSVESPHEVVDPGLAYEGPCLNIPSEKKLAEAAAMADLTYADHQQLQLEKSGGQPEEAKGATSLQEGTPPKEEQP